MLQCFHCQYPLTNYVICLLVPVIATSLTFLEVKTVFAYLQRNSKISCWDKSLQWIPTSIDLQMPMCSYHCLQSSSSNMLLESKDWRFQKFDNTCLQTQVVLDIFFHCWKEGKRWRFWKNTNKFIRCFHPFVLLIFYTIFLSLCKQLKKKST